ncbi:hypothetical protein BDV09DRAFT_97147 [Aspergillus tetrazonus]
MKGRALPGIERFTTLGNNRPCWACWVYAKSCFWLVPPYICPSQGPTLSPPVYATKTIAADEGSVFKRRASLPKDAELGHHRSLRNA